MPLAAATVRIAIAKTVSADARAALEPVLASAAALDDAEARFAHTVAEHRAQRGDKPTRHSKSTRRMLRGFEQDEERLGAELLRDLGALDTPHEVLLSLRSAMASDVEQSGALLKHYPDADRPLGEALLALKQQLLARLDAFLLGAGSAAPPERAA